MITDGLKLLPFHHLLVHGIDIAAKSIPGSNTGVEISAGTRGSVVTHITKGG